MVQRKVLEKYKNSPDVYVAILRWHKSRVFGGNSNRAAWDLSQVAIEHGMTDLVYEALDRVIPLPPKVELELELSIL